MSTFFQPLTLIADNRSASVEALVDTGSAFTSVPESVLVGLGIAPHRTVRMKLADGRVHVRRLGWVVAELEGQREQILCAFGGAGDLPTIGAHTLEALLLAVDPVEERLVPVDAFWAWQHAAPPDHS